MDFHGFPWISATSCDPRSCVALQPQSHGSRAAVIEVGQGPLFMYMDQFDFQILFVWLYWFYMTDHDRWSVARPGFKRQPDSWLRQFYCGMWDLCPRDSLFQACCFFRFGFASFGFGNFKLYWFAGINCLINGRLGIPCEKRHVGRLRGWYWELHNPFKQRGDMRGLFLVCFRLVSCKWKRLSWGAAGVSRSTVLVKGFYISLEMAGDQAHLGAWG